MHLLDVNILIALIDRQHVFHNKVKLWFQKYSISGWATCPITENGLLRIISNPQYPNTDLSLEDARDLLEFLCLQPGHVFWEDSVSVTSRGDFPKLTASKQLTDLYLLALAKKNGGKLVSLDPRIEAGLISDGLKHFELLS